MRRPLGAAAAIAAIVLCAPSARAECTGYGPENAISVRPFSFVNHGVAIQYERFLAPPLFSVAAGPELRWGAHGDYSAYSLGLGIEPRFWLIGRSFFGCLGDRAMVGLYLGGRFDIGFTHLTDAVLDRSVGTIWTFSHKLLLGFRANVSQVEVTPSIGLTAITEAGGGASAAIRPTLSFGLTVGWMF